MVPDNTPQMRMSFRSHPGVDPGNKRTVGRTIWVGTTRFLSFLGGVVSPFAEAWNIAGGPGGEGGVILARFLRKFGHPSIQHLNEKVYSPRVASSPYAGMQAFNRTDNNQIRISTEVSESLGEVLATRYDATMGTIHDGNY